MGLCYSADLFSPPQCFALFIRTLYLILDLTVVENTFALVKKKEQLLSIYLSLQL